MFPPTSLSGRKSSTAMAMNLIVTLRYSILIDNLLKAVYDTSSLVDKCDVGLLDSGDEESEVDIEETNIDKSEVKWDCKSGLQANAV